MFFVVDNWFSINDETMTIALENSNMPLSQYCPNHDCSDCKIMELMASLRFGPRLLWKKQQRPERLQEHLTHMRRHVLRPDRLS